MLTYVVSCQQERQDHSLGQRKVFSTSCARKTGTTSKSMKLDPYTVYNIELKMGQRPKCKGWNWRTFRRKQEENHRDIGFGSDSLELFILIKPSLPVFSFVAYALATKEKKINWASSKLKTLAHQRTQSTEWKVSPQNGRKYLPIMYLLSNWHPEYLKSFPRSQQQKATQLQMGLGIK